jgi:hypothetical protein
MSLRAKRGNLPIHADSYLCHSREEPALSGVERAGIQVFHCQPTTAPSLNHKSQIMNQISPPLIACHLSLLALPALPQPVYREPIARHFHAEL